MPCDRVYLQRTDFRAASPEILRAALINAGMEITMENAERGYVYFRDRAGRTGSFQNGQFQTQDGIEVNEIKRAYSCEAAERAAKKYGFKIQKKTGTTSKFQFVRRGY